MQPNTQIFTTALRVFAVAMACTVSAAGALGREAAGTTALPRERPVLGAALGPVVPYPLGSYYPYDAYGYHVHPWPRGYGWPGAYGWHDAWLPFHAPGEGASVIWVAAGSHGYLGGGFATVQPLNENGWHYGLAVSYEQGRDWFWGTDYTHSEISPSVTWHGKRTSIYIGVSLSETRFDGAPRAIGDRSGELWDDDRIRSRHRLPDATMDRFTTRGAGIGLDHRLSENLGVSFGVSAARTDGARR
ncbi:MAG: hypothetical protein JJU00_14040 [Opitutales bacterium]|nr:hypothetical protein [Opitutales bacterium]